MFAGAFFIAKVTTLWATEYEFANSTAIYSENGSRIRYFENGTELHFIHNITYPDYLYENDINSENYGGFN
jgi:hypothetical protein